MLGMYSGPLGRQGDELLGGFTRMERSLLWRVAFLRTEAEWTRGRIGLQLAVEARQRGDTGAARRNIAFATTRVHLLDKQAIPGAPLFAALLRAGLAKLAGDTGAVVQALRRAMSVAEGLGAAPVVAPAGYRLAAILGGDEGASLRARGDAWMAATRIRNPARFTAMVVAGWPHPG
jgi:hypothetical protein